MCTQRKILQRVMCLKVKGLYVYAVVLLDPFPENVQIFYYYLGTGVLLALSVLLGRVYQALVYKDFKKIQM